MMKITVASLLISCVAVLGALNILRLLRKDSIHIVNGFFWIGIFIAVGFFALFPQFLDKLASLLMMKNRLFFLILSAIFILFGMLLYQTLEFSRLERKVNKIIQEFSFLDYQINENKTKNSDAGKNSKELPRQQKS